MKHNRRGSRVDIDSFKCHDGVDDGLAAGQHCGLVELDLPADGVASAGNGAAPRSAKLHKALVAERRKTCAKWPEIDEGIRLSLKGAGFSCGGEKHALESDLATSQPCENKSLAVAQSSRECSGIAALRAAHRARRNRN